MPSRRPNGSISSRSRKPTPFVIAGWIAVAIIAISVTVLRPWKEAEVTNQPPVVAVEAPQVEAPKITNSESPRAASEGDLQAVIPPLVNDVPELLRRPAPLQVSQAPRIVLVNYDKLQREYYRTHLERERFQTLRSAAMSEIEQRKQRIEELFALRDEAEENFLDPALPAAKKLEILAAVQRMAGQITSLQGELRDLEKRTKAELGAETNQIQTALTQEISAIIGSYAAAEGIDLVLNRTLGLQGVPALVGYFSTDNLEDITAQVSAKLSDLAPEGWSPAEEP